MSALGYARKADCRGKAVHHPWDPAVGAIAARDNRCNRERAGGMPGGEAAAFEGRFTAIKESMAKRSSSGNIGRPFSASNCLEHQVNHRAICISLCGK